MQYGNLHESSLPEDTGLTEVCEHGPEPRQTGVGEEMLGLG